MQRDRPMLMHYPHSREESAALLKRTIAEMGQHDAPFDPVSFAVWYEHLAGINPALSRALEQARQQQPRLDAAAVQRLYGNHIAPPDDEATQAVRGGMAGVMQRVAQQAEATGREASSYGSQLDGLQRVLATPEPQPAALSPRLTEVADGTQRMQSAVADLARSMQESQVEIDRLRQALERSRTEAITDPLSQLLNRKGFDEVLQRVLRQPTPPGRTHTLVILDIDHFKRINDNHGHPVGDSVIQALGQLLKRAATGEGRHAARIGGEEFALLLANSDAAQAAQLAQAVLTQVRGSRVRKRGAQEVVITFTVSAGIASHISGDDAESFVAAADAALYRSKAAGRDTVTVA